MSHRTHRYVLADLTFAVALLGVMLALGRGLWRADVFDEKFDRIAYFLLVSLLLAILLSWGLFGARRNAPECVECDRRFLPPDKVTGPPVCLPCRQRSLGLEGVRRERASGLRTVFVLLAIVACFMGFGLSDFTAAHFGRAFWFAVPILAVGATLGLLVALIIAYTLFALIWNRITQGERFAPARFRKIAGEAVRKSRHGPISLWYSDADDPAPMLLEQVEIVRGRFAAMVGEAVEVQSPIRIFCFARRAALVAFHRQAATDLWNNDGIYSPAPARILTITTEVVPHRTCDTEATARSLFALALLEGYKGYVPAPWLQAGINHALASGGEGLDRLNRKMVASISRNESLGEELFHLKPREFLGLMRNWRVHKDYVRLSGFIAQSRSLIDYLCGIEATDGRREKFRAYLQAIRRGEADEAAFRSHFGDGYGCLLEGWKGWVSGRGLDSHETPSPRMRLALTGRLIPSALDRRAKVMDRILAVRAMGWEGHALGADALIGLLRGGGEVLKEEVIRSLEMISGTAWGDDLDRWEAWWEGLPEDVREGPGQGPEHANKDLITDAG